MYLRHYLFSMERCDIVTLLPSSFLFLSFFLSFFLLTVDCRLTTYFQVVVIHRLFSVPPATAGSARSPATASAPRRHSKVIVSSDE